MGLAVVHSIISGCGGTIGVDSTPGIGTTFTVMLPQTSTASDRLEGEYCVIHGDDIVLLLVDDDDAARGAMSRALRQAGFEVDTAASGAAGLELFAKAPHRYGLVLADQSMPGMSGLQMATGILEMNPQARIVICTGHIEPSLDEQARKAGICGFARKPMSPKILVETVKKHCHYA